MISTWFPQYARRSTTLPRLFVHPVDRRQDFIHFFSDTVHHFQSVLFGVLVEVPPDVQRTNRQRKTSRTYVNALLPSGFPFGPAGQFGTVFQLTLSQFFGQIADGRRGGPPENVIGLDPNETINARLNDFYFTDPTTRHYFHLGLHTSLAYCSAEIRDPSSISES